MQPRNQDDYLRRFYANHSVDGFGLDTRVHMPCPFCAAADFAIFRIVDMREVLRHEATCAECGRSGRSIFVSDKPDEKLIEFVQTGGDDPPAWLEPKPRRELRADEVDLLRWLGREDFSQYGECHGAALDGLIAKGLAQVHEDRASQDRAAFIAKGDGPMYRAVSLTDAGVAALRDLHARRAELSS